MTYKVICGDSHCHFVEVNPGDGIGFPPNVTVYDFDTAAEAISKVLKVKPDFFENWNRDTNYPEGSWVKFNGYIFKAMEDWQAPYIPEEENLEFKQLESNNPTPFTFPSTWQIVFNPNEEESN